MAINPMQKKARNSMLLGIVIGLLIGMIAVLVLYLQLNKLNKELEERKASTKIAYVLVDDVKSGEKINIANVKSVEVTADAFPSDAISTANLTDTTIAKVDLKKGTVLSNAIVVESNEQTTADLREQEYNMIVLPQYLEENDYIDVRLMLPTGQDYIVLSKKRVKSATEDTIWIDVGEDEIVTMSNAIVEAYIMKGSKLYATTYTEPGNQNNATPTYPVSREVLELINSDPNIRETAKNSLWQRYNASQRNGAINSAIGNYQDSALQNIENNLEEEITKSKEARQEYLEKLGVNY